MTKGGTNTQTDADTECCVEEADAHEPPERVEGVVLAGVHAWGESVLESVLCRPLFPVANVPLVGHTLSWLSEGGIKKVKVCANSDTAALRRCRAGGESLDLQLDYYEDKMPRGPAGCTRDAVIGSGTDTFVVVEGTVLPQMSLAKLLAAHRGAGAEMTIVVADGDPARRGCEAQVERLEPAGIYVFSAAALSHVPATGYQDIKETLIPLLYSKNLRLCTFAVGGGEAPRVSSAASYMAISKWAVERLCAGESPPQGYVKSDGALIHESALLHGNVRFIGPVLIGPQCRIEQDAMLIGPMSAGTGCVIGRQSIVSRSVLWSGCKVGAGAVLDHCILTDAAMIREETVMRETVCLARAPRWSWADWIGRLWRSRTDRPKRASARQAGLSSRPPGKPILPNVTVRSDPRRVAASPAARSAREGESDVGAQRL